MFRAMKKKLLKAEEENKSKDGSSLLEVQRKKSEAIMKKLSMESDVMSLSKNCEEINKMLQDRKSR